MARPKRIDFTKVDRNDPRFFEVDPTNINKNISASTFDPTDPTSKGNPVGEKYNEWLTTANIGDKFDWGKESGDPTQKGVVNEFIGFNKMGTPIIQTNISEERANWQGAIDKAGPSYAEKIKALTDTGRNETEARFLLAQYYGPEYVSANAPKGKPTRQPVGILADGTPFYGWDGKGNPVTSLTGAIYSTTSSSDAITRFNSGSGALVVNSGSVITSPTTVTNPNVMTSGQQDVYSIMLGRLNQYNLGALAPLIRKLAIEGATESTIMLQLSEEPLYKERFKANEIRKQKGLSVLTPSQYLSLEDDYRQVLRAYGLTQFDNDAYVSQFLANDVSVSELSNRVVTAVQRVRNADPAVSSMLKNLYGIGQNDLVAYVLDPQQQFQKIERQVAASEISVAAARQGFNIGATVAEQLAAQGISQAEAQKGYSTIADVLPTAEKLSDIYGGQLEEYRLPEAEQEVFNQLASAQRKRRALTERELASFSGQAGLGRTSLTQQAGGQF